MDEMYKSLSVRLYDVMEHVGASEEMRQLHQSTAILEEIVHTMKILMADVNIQTYIFGSFIEGTTTPALNSDVDALHSHDTSPVHEYAADARDGKSFIMVRDDHHTRPGYVKLQFMQNGIPQTGDYSYKNEFVDVDRNGRLVCKHISSTILGDYVDERNGPADTHYLSERTYDSVNALRCSSIPSFADDWTKQKGKFNWPSKQMLDNMASSGCFFVGIGFPASDEKHLEWRLSFSLQERDLMLSFNPTQHKCYILLKMVKNYITVQTVVKCISSYHMKTCMFYVIHDTKSGLWIPENLCQCLILCLDRLRKWVYCGYCPNFFIKEENMFDREIHRQLKPQLSTLLDTLIKDGPEKILSYINCDNINKYLDHPKHINTSPAKEHGNNLRMISFLHERIFRHWLLSCCMSKDCTYSWLILHKMLKHLQNASICNRKPDNHCRQALFSIKTYIQYQLGCICMSIAFHVGESIIKDGFLKLAEYHFKQGRYCDKTSSRLMYASVLYKTEHNDRCVRLLKEVEAQLGHRVESSCSCHEVIYYSRNYTPQLSSFVNTASCVIFLPSLKNITPAPLLPEMSRSVDTPPRSRDEKKDVWFDCAAVDGKVYLNFLKYLAYRKLDQQVHKQVAIDNMQRLADSEPILGHRDTAYNLLGWILVQENQIVHGIRCLVKSWKIRPIHNAAKWHLGIAVYKHITQNKAQ